MDTRHLAIPTLLTALLAGPAAAAELDKTRTLPLQPLVGEVLPRIVGGGPASLGEQRWITSLQYAGEHFCGGALVRSDWVLTAAHCVIDESASGNQFSVWVGGNDLSRNGQGVRRDVTQIVIHPQYNDNTLRNDLALLRLASAIPASIEPVRLATSAIMGGPAAPNQPVTVSGWGALSENGPSPEVLHEVSLPLVSNATCNAPASYGGEVAQSMLCAGLRQGGKDSCQGDSGGPLWLTHEGQDYSVGIVSWGEGCAQPDKYGVYTRVASFRSWVENVAGIADDGGDGNDDGGDDGNDDGGDGDGNDDGGQCPVDDAILLVHDDIVTGLEAGAGESLRFAVDVPAGLRRIRIDTWGGSGDADLYVAFERTATPDDHDFGPFLEGNVEKVVIRAPTAGRWYVTVHGFEAFRNLKLRARLIQ